MSDKSKSTENCMLEEMLTCSNKRRSTSIQRVYQLPMHVWHTQNNYINVKTRILTLVKTKLKTNSWKSRPRKLIQELSCSWQEWKLKPELKISPEKAAHANWLMYCFRFLFGRLHVPGEIANNDFAKFKGVKEVYCGICARRELPIILIFTSIPKW